MHVIDREFRLADGFAKESVGMCQEPQLISEGESQMLVVELRETLNQARIQVQLWLIEQEY
jgi:hypothetical protein